MSKFFKKHFNKESIKHSIYVLFMTLLGTLILAIGDGLFLVPFNIVSGGITGLAILFSRAGILNVDIWSYIFMWGFFLLGVIFLGFKFTLQTLISTIFFPIFLSLILRTSFGNSVLEMLITDGMQVGDTADSFKIIGVENIEIGRLLLVGALGGMLCGVGCGITFSVGGSTGGTDILGFIMNKFFNVSNSISSFIIDGSIVFVGLIIALVGGVTHRYEFISGLVGIISALGCALMIEIFYSGRSEDYMCDVVSSKANEINDYVIHKLDRTTTIFKVNGGYKNDPRIMIRICYNSREYMKIKNAIANIDPNAFVMFYNCKNIDGLGFRKLEASTENTVTRIKKDIRLNRENEKIKKENAQDDKTTKEKK